MKYTGPKAKRCRKHGINLYGSDKYDKILQRKPYGPGKGPKDFTRGKLSEYGQQLKEKQKARDMYGLSERQFHRYYVLATKVSGQTGDALKKFLERRLDNVIYRAGFALTRLQARQMVSHGHVRVNGKKSNIPSLSVPVGATVSVIERVAKNPRFSEAVKAINRTPASWLSRTGSVARLVAAPDVSEPKMLIDVRRIVEFYSR